MIKTISHAECRVLTKMLKLYFMHVMTSPNTLLTRYFGLHKVRHPPSCLSRSLCSALPLLRSITIILLFRDSFHSSHLGPG